MNQLHAVHGVRINSISRFVSSTARPGCFGGDLPVAGLGPTKVRHLRQYYENVGDALIRLYQKPDLTPPPQHMRLYKIKKPRETSPATGRLQIALPCHSFRHSLPARVAAPKPAAQFQQ
jgi:hypothetical protein